MSLSAICIFLFSFSLGPGHCSACLGLSFCEKQKFVAVHKARGVRGVFVNTQVQKSPLAKSFCPNILSRDSVKGILKCCEWASIKSRGWGHLRGVLAAFCSSQTPPQSLLRALTQPQLLFPSGLLFWEPPASSWTGGVGLAAAGWAPLLLPLSSSALSLARQGFPGFHRCLSHLGRTRAQTQKCLLSISNNK